MYLSGEEAQGIKHSWTGRTALRKLRTSWLAHHKVAFRELLPSQNKYGLKKMPFQTATASSSDSPESSDQPRRIWNSCPKCSCSANILISRISAIPVRKLVEHPSKKRTSRCWIDVAMAQGPQLLECYIWLHSNLWQLLPWLYRLYPYPNCRIKYWLPFINITRGVHATLRVFKINTSLIVHFFLILSFPHSQRIAFAVVYNWRTSQILATVHFNPDSTSIEKSMPGLSVKILFEKYLRLPGHPYPIPIRMHHPVLSAPSSPNAHWPHGRYPDVAVETSDSGSLARPGYGLRSTCR